MAAAVSHVCQQTAGHANGDSRVRGARVHRTCRKSTAHLAMTQGWAMPQDLPPVHTSGVLMGWGQPSNMRAMQDNLVE
jgi:hypothetical protein